MPSRGSTMRVVTIAATVARTRLETTEKKKLATIVMGSPPASWIDSFVISVIIASDGVMSRFTPKIAPTPAKAAAMPASGWRPTLRKAAAPSGTRMR